MNRTLNWNFASVRIHADAAAAAAADGLHARAFTVGQDVAFSAGAYAPQTPDGRRLLAHELAHVVQQSRGGPVPRPAGEPGLEAGAAVAADAAARSVPITVAGASDVGIARDPVPGAADPQAVQQRLNSAIMEARWQEAAELLNGYNKEGIAAVIATLNQRQIESLHLGAVANGRVGSGAQVATVTLAAAPDLAKSRDALQASGMSIKEFNDYRTMTRGDFMDRYGVVRFFQVNGRVGDLPQKVKEHLVPAADQTVYLHASGLIGTKDQETNRARADQSAALDDIRSSALAAGVSLAAPLITDDKAKQRALVHLGALTGDIAGGVAPIGNARGTIQGPVANPPPNAPGPLPRGSSAPPANRAVTPPLDAAAIGAALDAAPGQRIFYGNAAAPSVAARFDRNLVTFDTETSAREVAVAFEELERTHAGGSLFVGSGTHGSLTGDWSASDPTLAEPQFFAEDLSSTAKPNLPALGARSVFDVAKPGDRAIYDAVENLVQSAPVGQRAAVRAWCFSTLRIKVP